MPGGVNSPARSWSAVGGDPLFIDRGSGPRVRDVDGNEYIDYVCSWGPLILGHAHPEVVEAVKAAAESGTSFGAPTEMENVLAGLVLDALPSLDLVRFVSSGTEAAMSALRLARAYTGRSKIVKFEGRLSRAYGRPAGRGGLRRAVARRAGQRGCDGLVRSGIR